MTTAVPDIRQAQAAAVPGVAVVGDAASAVHVNVGGIGHDARAVSKTAALAAVAAMAGLADREPIRPEFVLRTREWMGPYGERLAGLGRREAKPERKCRLPGCSAMHRHNGGYCCAQHCQEHKRLKIGGANVG